MATIEHIEVDNWSELSSTIDKYFTHFNNYIFRGLADAKWKLESTLTRTLREHYKKSSDKKTATAEHLRLFKENIRGRTTLSLTESTDDEIWALGQHFGLHTPLLDWSRSPYVAVFFDCASGNRALWAMLESDIQRISSDYGETKKLVSSIHLRTTMTDWSISVGCF